MRLQATYLHSKGASSLTSIWLVVDGPSSTGLEGPCCPQLADQVCSVHVQAMRVKLGRNLEQGKYPEKVDHGRKLLEVYAICLIPSLNTYSPEYKAAGIWTALSGQSWED